MEHSSRKSHVANVTRPGMNAIVHEEHLLGQRQGKYMLIYFISLTFTIRVIVGWPMGQPAQCLMYCNT